MKNILKKIKSILSNANIAERDKLKEFEMMKINNDVISINCQTDEQSNHKRELLKVQYTDSQIKQYIREVVSEAKATVKVDTGYLKRSIKGDWIAKDKLIEFRQADYGQKNGNSKLFEIANKNIPNDLRWRLVLINDDGVKLFHSSI